MKWIKNKLLGVLFSFSVVDKKILTHGEEQTNGGNGLVTEKDYGTLLHGLKNSIVNEEVKNLRWRILKVLDASNDYIVTSLGVDEDGFPILDTSAPDIVGQRVLLAKIKMDEYDDYPLELVVDNNSITMGSSDIMANENIGAYGLDEVKKSITLDEDGNASQATLAEMSSEDYQSYIKAERPVKIVRDLRPKFEIEKYAKKLNIRKISNTEKLLEFYISKYPDEYDRKTRLLISEIKRAITNPRFADMLDIVGVGFTSYKTIGVKDFYQFQYKISNFDKIIEYNGYYVIKFKAEVIMDGEYLLEKYRMEELDNKYKNKEAKK